MSSLTVNSIIKGKKYNYRIEEFLGKGSFGITYKAKVILSGDLGNLGTEITVAVKEFFMSDINVRHNSEVITGANTGLFYQYRQKFIKEAENLSKLNHPNIIKVLELFEANNTAYYSMEYIEGDNLEKFINSQIYLSEKESLELLLKIMDATQCMHHNFMLHLDIKPMNIMIRKNKEPVLIDFGLSKQFNIDGSPESHTTIGAGSPGYAPLEQWSYKKEDGFSPTLDVYALGATLYKMLTGMMPPDPMSILNEGFPEQYLIDKGINKNIIFIVKSAMNPLKNSRYQSVEKLIKAVSFVLNDASSEKRSGNVDITLKRSERRNSRGSNTLPSHEIINGVDLCWDSSLSEEERTALKQDFEYLDIVDNEYRLIDTSYDGEFIKIGDYHRSFYDYSQFIFNKIKDKNTESILTINQILSLILKLSDLTGIPFRLAYDNEIKFMITRPPHYIDKIKTLCLNQDDDLVYFKGWDNKKTYSINPSDYLYNGWEAQIATDFSKPIVVDVNKIISFDVPFTQEVCDELKYIGFNLFKARIGGKWNIKSPLKPWSNYLPEKYDYISDINIWTIPGGGPYGGYSFLGVCAKINEFTLFYRFERNHFILIKRLSQSEIESRRLFT